MTTHGVVIVGAGEAGVRAAFTLRERGYDAAVTVLSEEAVLPYERPPLSKSGDAARPIMPGEAYAEANITLRLGAPVEAIDPERKVVRLSRGVLAYDKLLLTSGAEARRLPEMRNALYLRRDTDALAILSRLTPGSRLVILGAGFIGLELAATARARGAEVTVIELAERILARAVLPELARALRSRHETEGVRLVTGLKATPHQGGVLLENGEKVPADLLVVGIGSVPRVDLAEKAGLEVDNGVVVDEAFRSSAPDVFAAGDCCAIRSGNVTRRFESWRVARDQAERAAESIMSQAATGHPVPYFWSDQYDLCLQVAGIPDPERPALTRPGKNGGALHFQLDEAGRISSVSGLGVGTSLSREIKLSEHLIARDCRPDPTALCDPSVSLKSL